MPLSPSQTRALLESLEHRPNKKLGQNFLIDGNIVRKSIELAEVKAGNTVVEIGPGLGTLSKALLETGAQVWAVERDARLAAHLRTELRSTPEFHLIEGDCLEHPAAGLPEPLISDDFKIVANLPYAVSTPWMDAVLAGPLPSCMVLMLQKEAGDRYAAESGSKNFGTISIILQSAYAITGRHPVAPNCFYPAPKVGSILLRLERRADCIRFSSESAACMRRIFTQRRKQLGALCRRDANPRAIVWFEGLLESGVSPTVRPEDLALEHWQKLSKIVS